MIDLKKSLELFKRSDFLLEKLKAFERFSRVDSKCHQNSKYGFEMCIGVRVNQNALLDRNWKDFEGIDSDAPRELRFYINMIPDENRPARGVDMPVSFDDWRITLDVMLTRGLQMEGTMVGWSGVEREEIFQDFLSRGPEAVWEKFEFELIRLVWPEEFEEIRRWIANTTNPSLTKQQYQDVITPVRNESESLPVSVDSSKHKGSSPKKRGAKKSKGRKKT